MNLWGTSTGLIKRLQEWWVTKFHFWLQSKLQERVKAGESKLREMELKLEGDRVKHAQVLAHEVAKVLTGTALPSKNVERVILRGHELKHTTNLTIFTVILDTSYDFFQPMSLLARSSPICLHASSVILNSVNWHYPTCHSERSHVIVLCPCQLLYLAVSAT